MATICPICGSGPIFAGNADEHGLVVDLYHECACPPPATDADFDDCGYPGETDYPASIDVPVVDYDLPLRERIDGTLPSFLLA